MTPLLREYLLKGVFLGLWAYLALVQPPGGADWDRFGRVVAGMILGLGLGFLIGALTQIRRGFPSKANTKAFLLVVLLESPVWIFIGIIFGLALGVTIVYDPREGREYWLAYCAGGGLLIGYGFHQLGQIKDWLWRFSLAALVGTAFVYLAVSYLGVFHDLDDTANKRVFGIILLIGLPFFYLLTFSGEAEESEVEIAALAAGLGIGLWLVFAGTESVLGDKAIFLAPLGLYFVYVTRIMPSLRVFKHTLRGYSALTLGKPLDALAAFKKALKLSPKDELATAGMWELHQQVDMSNLPADSTLLSHLDYEFCLDRAEAHLLGNRAPTPAERQKAEVMLNLVERQKPALAARVDYLRAVSLTHAKQFDAAAGVLSKLLDPETPCTGNVRNAVLFPAWDLALRLHPELVKRLGDAELAKPGRRMQAIAAVERKLAVEPTDGTAAELKAILYAGLTEAEFVADAASGPPSDFNYDYVEQLGLALSEDTERMDRAAAYLRIAGRGLPERGAGIFSRLAAMTTDPDAQRGYLEQVKRSGLQLGVQALPADQKALYFTAVRTLSATAEARGDYDTAVADLRLSLDSGTGELEVFRKLADLYEKNSDPMNALLMTETALVYSGKDADLLAKKDKYYYSVDPDRLTAVRDKVFRFFDTDYCLRKAKQVLDQREPDAESLDWARHLAKLARIIKPDSLAVQWIEARTVLRMGDREAALHILEDIREAKPSGSDEQEAWYAATKTLGDMYLNELNRPDLAVRCYLDYRDYSKSGADTLFNIARSYEASGDAKNALRFYESVTGYDQHPKYWDATEAVRRLKGESAI